MHVQPRNEGDVFGTVGYFALGSADPRALVPVNWNRTGESTAHDPGLQQRLRALRAGLKPLARLTATAMPWRSEVVARSRSQMLLRSRSMVRSPNAPSPT